MFLADDLLGPSDQADIARRLLERLIDASRPREFGGNQYTEGFWLARRDQTRTRFRVQIDRMRSLGLHASADLVEAEAETLMGKETR